ncbi:MAG: hypothetical protein WA055_05280 [Candidatus Moraniibacteriota bacterium]
MLFKKQQVYYTIYIESIYTGDQTLTCVEGSQFFEGIPYKDLNIGPNGLPVTGSFPEHASINFKLSNGKDAILNVPVTKPVMVAIVEIEGVTNAIWVIAKIERKSTDHISVVATTATPEEIEKINSI